MKYDKNGFNKQYRTKYFIIIVLSFLLVIAFFANFHFTNDSSTKISDWIGFWGGVLGSILGILSSFLILISTLNEEKKQFFHQKLYEKNLKDIYDLENNILENILYFSGHTLFYSFSRDKDLIDIKNDIIIQTEISKRKFEIFSHRFLDFNEECDQKFIEAVYNHYDNILTTIGSWDINTPLNDLFNNLKEILFNAYSDISNLSYELIKTKKENLSSNL